MNLKMYINNDLYKEDVMKAAEMVPEIERLYKKKFLITGATGLVASFLIDIFMYLNLEKKAEIQIVALGRDQHKLCDRFRSYSEDDRLKFLVQDVCEPLKVQETFDYMIHAAGDGYPAAFRKNPVGTMMPALTGTYHVLEYARNNPNCRVVYVSSGEVYGQGQEHQSAFTEDYCGPIELLNPRSCYPSAKRAAETLCAAFLQQYQVDFVIARLGHTFGPNTTSYDNRANVQFINNVLNQEDIVLHSKGNQLRSYTYIADSAAGILTVLLEGRSGEAYNIARTNENITIADFASIVAEAGKRKCIYSKPNEIEKEEQTPIRYAVLDSVKLQKLGWHSFYPVKKGVCHTISILKDIRENSIEGKVNGK